MKVTQHIQYIIQYIRLIIFRFFFKGADTFRLISLRFNVFMHLKMLCFLVQEDTVHLSLL